MKICKLLAACGLVVLLWSPTVYADDIALGSDYFQTQSGTFFNFGGPIGIVDFMGSPIGPGMTDTIIERLNDITIGAVSSAPNIEIKALSLASTAPVTLGGTTYNVSVGLASGPKGPQDMGIINIFGTTAGGTFTSTLDVYFDAHFSPISGPGPAFDVVNTLMLTNSGAPWSPTPTPGQVLVMAADCDGPSCTPAQIAADQAANKHSGLGFIGAAGGPPSEVDFFVTGPFTESKSGGGGEHVVGPAPTPVPASLILLGSGLLGLGSARRALKKR
jgi:hypothetical protein